MRRERIVIVGAGPAGSAAAVQCARLGVRPLLLDRAGLAGGLIVNAFKVENYPGLEAPLKGTVFAERLRAHLERFGLSVEKRELSALESKGERFLLRCKDCEIETEALILAVGTEPVRPGIEGESELYGKLVFSEVQDALKLSPRRALVLGGGEAAFDYSLSLAASGADVRMILRGEKVRAKGRLKRMVEENERIGFWRRCRIAALSEQGGGVSARLEIPGGNRIETADVVVLAIGRQSRAIGLMSSFLWKPSKSLLTSRPGLFIAGDARCDFLGQAGIAVGDGLLAAMMAVDHVNQAKD